MFTMDMIYISLITALGLVGVVLLNLKILLTSFKSKTTYTFLRNIRSWVICQFAYHVSVLLMNTVDAWTRLNVPQEYCSTIYLLISTFMTFFVGGNMMAILVMESRNPVAYQIRGDFFPTRKLFVAISALAIGLTAFIMLRYYACFRQHFTFHVMVVISIIIVVTIVILLLVASDSSLQVDNISPAKLPTKSLTKPLMKPKISLPSFCGKDKGIALFVVLLLM